MVPRRISIGVALGMGALFLALGIAAGAVMRARLVGPKPSLPARTPISKTSSPADPVSGASPSAARSPSLPADPPVISSSASPSLDDRLRRVRTILVNRAKEGRKAEGDLETYRALLDGWQELHQAAVKDPPAYLAFLRAKGNEDLCEGLLDVLALGPRFGGHRFFAQDLPTPILEGVRDLLSAGTAEQQVAAARFVRDLTGGAPSEKQDFLVDPCLALLSGDDPRARAAAVDLLRYRRPERLDESLPIVSELWKRSDDEEVRRACLSALAASTSPAGAALFYEKASESARDHLSEVLPLVQSRLVNGTADDADRCGGILLAALQGAADPLTVQSVAATALDLPIAKANEILQRAAACASSAEDRDRLLRMVAAIKSGEVRSDRLRAILTSGAGPF